ncbi:MAG TPA: type II secretion system protein [Gemmatimonadales bacterium]
MSKLIRLLRDESRGFARDERGISLPEELMSIAILALAVGLVVVGIFTASVGTKVRHARVNATSLARSQMELVLDGSYSADPTAVPYPTVAPVSGYTVAVGVEYWTAPSGPFVSTVRNDGLQRVTVSVSDADGEILDLEGYVVNR